MLEVVEEPKVKIRPNKLFNISGKLDVCTKAVIVDPELSTITWLECVFGKQKITAHLYMHGFEIFLKYYNGSF